MQKAFIGLAGGGSMRQGREEKPRAYVAKIHIEKSYDSDCFCKKEYGLIEKYLSVSGGSTPSSMSIK